MVSAGVQAGGGQFLAEAHDEVDHFGNECGR